MDENAVENMVRFGTVSVVDPDNRRARVIYQDKGMTSGWLYVLRYPGLSILLEAAGDHTHDLPEGGSTVIAGEHSHTGIINDWLPVLGDTVVVLYIPVFNGDGFILGAI